MTQRSLLTLSLFALLACLPALADNFPPGTYKDNSKPTPFGGGCSPISINNGKLVASCPDFFGKDQTTSLPDADKCVADKHDIENINGNLRCVISSQDVKGSHPYKADIVSISSDVKSSTDLCLAPPNCPAPNQETKVFRIDQPRVDVASDDIRTMKFDSGERVVLNAGGCVQTGIAGWESYVHPTLPSPPPFVPDPFHSGTAWIPSASGQQQQSIAEMIGKTFTAPTSDDTALNKGTFLSLGYRSADNSGSGYYKHDDGPNNQCRNVGPAWVEVTVVRSIGPTLKTVSWSPHSRPFDLVWDMNNEDFNGLPLNPEWAWQLDHPGYVPDFSSTCKKAFYNNGGDASSGGNAIHSDILAQDCTSQNTILDVSTSSLVGDSWLHNPAYCTGLIDGHLNWMIATYTGSIAWQEFSGDPGISSFWLNDGDLNFGMQSLGGWVADAVSGGMNPANTPLGQTTNEEGLGLEFRDVETVYRAGGPWWTQLSNAVQNNNMSIYILDGIMANPYMYLLSGVVTGEIGIDGVHGGYAESHPVFAMALNTSEVQVKDGVQQTWAWFLRNSGNGGGCSERFYNWPSKLNNEYFIQLEWPEGATDVKVVKGTNLMWPWQDGDIHVSVVRSAPPEPPLTLIKVKFPPNSPTGGTATPFGAVWAGVGVDGQFTLEYSFAPGHQAKPRKPAPPAHAREKEEKEDGFKLDYVTSRIVDPATKAKFAADAHEALKQFEMKPPAKRPPITLDDAVTVEPHAQRAAGRGESTQAQTSPDPGKKQLEDATKKLIDTYRPKMQAAPPANK